MLSADAIRQRLAARMQNSPKSISPSASAAAQIASAERAAGRSVGFDGSSCAEAPPALVLASACLSLRLDSETLSRHCQRHRSPRAPS